MKIYLDNCSLQRPLDTKSHPRIILEAEAVLACLDLCDSGHVKLIASEVLLFEMNRLTNSVRREHAKDLLAKANIFVPVNDRIAKRSRHFGETGIKSLDALHLSSAIEATADFFCTCDDRFLKKAKSADTLVTRVVSPLELILEIHPWPNLPNL